MNDELYIDVKNKTLYADNEKINDFLLNIMIENNVNVCVCLGMPAIHPDHHYSSCSAEQRMTDAIESARERIPMLNQVHYNTGGATRTLSNEEFLSKWHSRRLEDQLNIRQIFEQQFMLNTSRYFDEINTIDSHYARDRQDRLDKRHLSQEEFKKEILSRSRPKNDWFRRRHEKKRFMRGL